MERVDADLVPFAQNNPSGYRFAFGTDTATDDINANYNDNIKKGWGTTPNEFPEIEDFNGFAYTTGYLISYLYQMGIAEWNNKQKYRQYSRVIGSDGKIYKAKTGTDLAPNVNLNPTTSGANWEIDNQFDIDSLTAKTTPADADNLVISDSTTSHALKKTTWANIKTALNLLYVGLTGNQTIAGVKNFTSAPTLNNSLIYARSNILGTVSQTGGVPTGAVIEKGSNANGEFVRYADGTLICTGSVTPASNNNNGTTVTFASTFISNPVLLASNNIGSAGLASSRVVESVAETTTTGKVKVLSHGTTTITDITSQTTKFTAIGRWF